MKKCCSDCRGTGLIEYYALNGLPIYQWMKPHKKACNCVEGDKYRNDERYKIKGW